MRSSTSAKALAMLVWAAAATAKSGRFYSLYMITLASESAL
jgi:hypothetical protein